MYNVSSAINQSLLLKQLVNIFLSKNPQPVCKPVITNHITFKSLNTLVAIYIRWNMTILFLNFTMLISVYLSSIRVLHGIIFHRVAPSTLLCNISLLSGL